MVRNTVKLVLLDDDFRLLLVHGQDPVSGDLHWYPVGGGVEEGEDLQTAGAREAWEETGLDGLGTGVLVWVRDCTYQYAGRRVEVHEDWLLHRVRHFHPAPAAPTGSEKASVRGFRWWSAAELVATTESVYPPELGTHLARLLVEGPPERPLDLGDESWRDGLLAREPVFDHPEHIWDQPSFDREVAPDFVEVGASGQWYGRQEVREVVLGRLAGTHAVSLPGGYRVEDAQVVEIVPGMAQVRYTLHAQGRVTRRSTLYRRGPQGWQVVFHQGTVVPGAVPLPPDHPEPRHG